MTRESAGSILNYTILFYSILHYYVLWYLNECLLNSWVVFVEMIVADSSGLEPRNDCKD